MVKGISFISWVKSLKPTKGEKSMQSPGEILREERQERGLLLEDISAVTRIPVETLEALEDNRFDKIPAPVFVKGFLRNYARELGIDEGQILAAYNPEEKQALSTLPKTENSIDNSTLPNTRIRSKRISIGQTKSKRNYKFNMSYALVILVILLSLLLSFLFLDTNSSEEDYSYQNSNVPSTIHVETSDSRWILHDESPPVPNSSSEKQPIQ